ncbi:MAG: hypothetical protein G01um101430_3 [Parcubacteria group bacterium Gr01-1014_30]|nr:MAG: hypothetical protein G01um101430_3 [Parcubacteria group bacterium Gr01-1014_30]
MTTKLLKKSLIVVAIGAVVLGGIGLTLNQTAAQKGDERSENPAKTQEKNPLRALAGTDSRLVDVPKACIADEITIKEAKAEGVSAAAAGNSCENAKADCRKNLAKQVAKDAEKECNNYTKVQNDAEVCKAHRGNFNPTENIKYEPENCTERVGEHGHKDFFVSCKIVKPVQYNCN